MWEKAQTWLKMDDWARQLNNQWIFWDIANALDSQSKEDSTKLLDKLWLPKYKELSQISLKDFLENPNLFFEQIPSSLYYVSIIPNNKKSKRFACYGKNWAETISNILSTINDLWENIWNYDIIVHEFYENIYWWSIIIKPNNFVLEFKQWKQSEIARWTAEASELMHITKWMLDSWFLYSFEDEELRKTIFELIIKKIPHTLDWNHIDFTYMWYYEFAIWSDPKKDKLVPIFFDFKPSITI